MAVRLRGANGEIPTLMNEISNLKPMKLGKGQC